MAGSLGSLVIELAANTARLQSDMGKAVGIAERAAGQIKNAFRFAGGGLIGAALIGAAKQSIEFGDSINKAAIKAGIGSTAMSELAYAAKLADVDIASLSTALKKMQVSLSEAGTGAQAPKEALAALGLTFDQVQKRKPEAQFELIADRISKLTDPADRARAAVEIFGKAGADLLPLFAEGAAGIAKARAEAEKLGLSFSGDQIKALSTADDSIKRLDASWKGFAATLTAAVAPALSGIFDMFSGMDTRSVDKQIRDIDAMIEKARTIGLGPGVDSGKALQGLLSERAALVGRRDLDTIRSLQTGTSGGPQSRGRDGYAVGFAQADAAAKAAAAAKTANDATLKEQEKFNKEAAALRSSADQDIQQDTQDTVSEEIATQIEYYNKLDELRKEDEEKLKEYKKQQASQLSENAQIVKDAFMTSWDAWFRNGKFRIDELFKYILVEFARRGISKLFDSIFLPKEGGGAGAGGWLDKVVGAIGGIFGGHKAGGGSVQAGKFYEVGERGRELFAPGMSGSIIPNHALAGGGGVSFVTNIDARGATMELVRVLPRILDAHKDQVIAEVDERLKRRKIGIR